MVSHLPTRTNVLLMTGQLRPSSGFSPHSAPCTRLRTTPTLSGPSIRLICLLRCSTLAISLDLSPGVDVEGYSHMSEVECALVCQHVTPPAHSSVMPRAEASLCLRCPTMCVWSDQSSPLSRGSPCLRCMVRPYQALRVPRCILLSYHSRRVKLN